MTEYLDLYKPTCTSDAIHHATMSYVLDECHLNPDVTSPDYGKFYVEDVGKELLQLMFDKSPIKMRMYGSAKELAENVKIYRDFPESHSYFGEFLEPYFTTPIIYKSLKNEPFISKADIYSILHHIALQTGPPSKNLVIATLIKYSLKSREERTGEYTEFVPLDKKVFDEIRNEISQVAKEIDDFDDESFDKLCDDLVDAHSDELLKKLKSYIPSDWNSDEEERIGMMLEQIEEQTSKMDPPVYGKANFFIDANITMRHLLKVIEKRPEMFLPHSETKDNKMPITVRLFEDGDQKFVMKAELFNAIKRVSGLNIEYKDEGFMFGTMNMEDVVGKYEKNIRNIEFIRYPIQRAKHRAVPIPGFDLVYVGNHGIPALDVLFEFLRICFFEFKLFQKCEAPLNFKFLVPFQEYFLSDYEVPYFIRTRIHTLIRESSHNTMKTQRNNPANEIRNVKSNGFTVQNLKNELAYLKLTASFPDIQEHAEVVYAYVDRVKKEKVLRTCDMYDAVEYCQLICIFERLPKYKRFLHNQGGCGRVPGLNCDLCAVGEAKKKSDYLDHCESVLTLQCLHCISLRYLFKELRTGLELKSLDYSSGFVKDNGETFLQSMFDKCKFNMRVYGSAKELAENVKIYSNFPRSYQYFKLDYFPFFTTPTIYHSLKNKKFISKPDLFVVLQSMLIRAFGQPRYQDALTIWVVSYFLKSQDKRVKGHIEFVPFDQKVLDEIWNKIRNVSKSLEGRATEEDFFKLKKEVQTFDTERAVEKLKSMIPNAWNEEEDYKQVTSMIEPYLKGPQDSSHEFRIAFELTRISSLIRTLQEVFNASPEMFLPHSETKDNKLPITVRMFEDGGHRFVMKAEVFSAMKIDYGFEFDDKDGEVLFETLKMEDVLRQYGSSFKDIEFIRYPIQRTKHRAVPINGPDGFCMLAVDALFDLLNSLVFEMRVFQKFDNWKAFETMFLRYEAMYELDENIPYFVNARLLEMTRFSFNKRCAEWNEIPSKDIRNAKADGFTVQNLKNELAHLRLTMMFPEIQYRAEVVYAHVDRVKKEKVLRTCDLIDAVEYCQLICLFERLPKYKKFLHNQGACGRVPGLKCDLCAEFKKSPTSSSTPVATKSNKKVAEQLLDKFSKLSVGSDL